MITSEITITGNNEQLLLSSVNFYRMLDKQTNTDCSAFFWESHEPDDLGVYTFKSIGGAKRSTRKLLNDCSDDYIVVYWVSESENNKVDVYLKRA